MPQSFPWGKPLPDYYRLLGLERDATAERIKEAYKNLAMLYHPDRSADPADHERFRLASDAYRVLSDPVQRRRYDTLRLLGIGLPLDRLSELARDPMFSRDIMKKVGGFFAAVSGIVRKSESSVGRDLRVEAEISSEEAKAGLRRHFEYGRDADCAVCKGVGFSKVAVCETCRGAGRLTASWLPHVGKRCPRCDAKGWIGVEKCAACSGSGRALSARKIQADIPAGIADDARLRIKGHGEGGRGGGADGDLIVHVRVKAAETPPPPDVQATPGDAEK